MASSRNLLLWLPCLFAFVVKLASSNQVCQITDCWKEAQAVENDIDPSVKPCDNFYQFTCNNFLKRPNVTTHKELLVEYMSKVKTQLLTGIYQIKYYRTQALMIDFYQSCMNESGVEQLGLQPVKSILELNGGWPVLQEKRNDFKFNLTGDMFKLWRHGVYISPFFSMDKKLVQNGKKNMHLIKIGCGSAGYDIESIRDHYDQKVVNRYTKYMIDVAKLFGAQDFLAKSDMDAVKDLEVQLLRRCRDLENQPLMTIEKMNQLYPLLDWKSYITEFLQPTASHDLPVQIQVTAPGYLSELFEILKNYTDRTKKNYVGWVIANSHPNFLNKALKAIRQPFCGEVGCYYEKRERKEVCEELVTENFMLADGLGLAYQRIYSSDETIFQSIEMTKDIRAELSRTVTSMTWMEQSKYNEMRKKVGSYFFGVGVPYEWSKSFTDELYKELNIDSGLFYDNIVSFNAFHVRYSDRKQKNTDTYNGNIKVAINTDDDVGTYQIKTAHCQGIYFNPKRPLSMNYGGLGVRLGREVLSGYYKYFNYEESEVPRDLYRIIKCFKQRFRDATSHLKYKQLWSDVESEMLSVMGSMSLVYRTYQKYQKYKVDKTLPELSYTPKQLFWISVGRDLCSGEKIDDRFYLTNEQKANLYFSTQKAFRQDWNCPASSPMAQGDTCQLW